jgi:TetR/AcrR family transcriptional regulator, transcriptional repressor for nem operon
MTTRMSDSIAAGAGVTVMPRHLMPHRPQHCISPIVVWNLFLTERSRIGIQWAMARTKEFDQEEALDKAMNLFWERGYEATSIQDLVDATGVQRQSLYDTFGSKHEIFLSSLTRYQAKVGDQVGNLKKRHQGGLQLVKAVFESCAAQTVSDARGCFVANCGVELSTSDEIVAEKVRMGRDGIQALFKRCLEQAQKSGELKPLSSPSALAHFLVNAYFGLRFLAKTRPSKAMIDDVVSVTFAALR